MGDPGKWTPDDVAAQLYQIGLGRYGVAFVENKISGQVLFHLNDSALRDIGLSTAHRVTFNSWVNSLHKPLRQKQKQEIGRMIASPKQQVRPPFETRQAATRSTTRPANRLFSQSLKKTPARDDYEYEYRPRQTGAQRYGYQPQEEAFNIGELVFVPPAPMKKLPQKIGRPGQRGRGPKIPETGECDNRAPCHYCGRNFAIDRLPVHESICATTSKKRRVFNSQKQRLAGTEAAVYARSSYSTNMSSTNRSGGVPKYKIEHEQLVAALRAARGAPVPRSYAKHQNTRSDDRSQCRYCGRRFGPEQYERHVRFCSENRPAPRGQMTLSNVARGNRKIGRK